MIKELNAKQKALIEEIEKDCDIELAWYFLNETPDDVDDVIEYCEERINEIEVIYYVTAMDYLREHDASLRDSLSLVSEYGFEIENINSEVLATVLMQAKSREELENYRDELERLFFNSDND